MSSKLPISKFKEIDFQSVKEGFLLTRKDKKYVLDAQYLPQIINSIGEEYQLMTVSGQEINEYSTTYYDTPDFEMYHMHHNGKKNRYKIRTRTYEVTDSSFIEFKAKNNKSITVKDRKAFTPDTFVNHDIEDLISNQYEIDTEHLEEKITIRYERLTFIGAETRITIDRALTFANKDKFVSLDNLAIVEFKYARNQHLRSFNRSLLDLGIRPMSISKYCIGISFLYDIKKNNFLGKIRKIKGIIEKYRPSKEKRQEVISLMQKKTATS